MTQNIWDAVIVGGGPAGLSAAQTLGRSLRRVLVVDEGNPRNRFASHMHNILGFDGVPPTELAQRGRAEVEKYGVEFRDDGVRWVTDAQEHLRVELGDGYVATRALIVATGVTDELPAIPGLAEHWGSTVLHCPYCHGWEVRGQRLAVIPNPDFGVHQAKLVRQLSEQVVLFTDVLSGLDEATTRALKRRGIELEAEPIAEIVGEAGQVSMVRTASGREIAVDAIFTAGMLKPHDGFLKELELERADSPLGSFIAVDQTGRTSHPRVWAAGNVVTPTATVPLATGAGMLTGAAVNGVLVEEDFERAAHGHSHGLSENTASPAEFWEELYSGDGPRWSGRVNQAIAELVSDWQPGRSLDLGCGEGGDVMWLAERGWQASGIDLSQTAIARAREAAEDRGLDRASFEVADLADWIGAPPENTEQYDLITASFLQSPVELPRADVLCAAVARLAEGGRLVIVAHAAAPSFAPDHHSHAEFPTPENEVAMLGLDPEAYAIDVAEVRTRVGTAPDGQSAEFEDSVVVVRRVSAVS
ncbi:NAD(P)/FAD-dependent oxidoreductase [Leucobacter coleopterorum]|uniref:NAD(P)/FAD-dependent oxidoreductase n=1 Tax=Leucobacter coleopterorum TaxID=2714933 RepID=A0ABX6JYA1_9MICO|nr:bifunctional NAD(P)/FAD-dependent oxidoreductase/class I SAM-dependent methyltransferase [Leucobacter coleopterorum]QIM17819.1 NAD(P)/FAD-dependent oxidoreductase [Leucobacter coleopterorum]